MEVFIDNTDDLGKAAKLLLPYLKTHSIVAFYAAMGAGKTTFIKEICAALAVTDSVTSPTYSIINEYRTAANKPIYHFDFYRINSIQEAIDIGCEDYFFSGNICLLEWPERIESLLPGNLLKVKIEVISEAKRMIKIVE
ncbi:MAG: tRNA (adenosine(37)-N6)-threonylcarbamoyltransferase complex ATPase subunit type 1 TsaE [Bacteroidetes bacterium]|nr:tRNA (adenosine(37)-N6)-threonylcarbamoyltransferase complex ATPase subunit type 1 TsaE [Bacteroidota bacterium]